MLEKNARKPSSDPIQEKLRQEKANWNKEVSLFINDLIHLKKTMNGWPSKFYKERSSIGQPIPADPNTIIGSLAGDFQQLAQRGEAIVQEQLNYSKNRRQKQPKPAAKETTAPIPSLPQITPAGGPDLSKQLAAWEQKYGEELIAQGSSKLTRTWTRTLNFPRSIGWGSGAKKRRHRMNMLKRAATVYKLLGKLQVKIVAPLGGRESVKESYEILRTIKNEWDIVDENLQSYKEIVGDEIPKEEKEPKKNQDQILEPVPAAEPQIKKGPADDVEAVALAKAIKNEYTSILRSRIGTDAAAAISGVVNDFMSEPGVLKYDKARLVIQQYNALLEALRSKYGVVGNNLKEIDNAISTKEKLITSPEANIPKNASEKIEIMAQDFIRKYIGKSRHSIFSGDDSDLRINIFDMAKELRQEVDEFLDMAESRKTLTSQYEEKSKNISSKIQKAFSHMMKLYRLYFRVPKEMQGLI